MCKQVITKKDGETRECRFKPWRDGYCKFHHPGRKEEEAERERQHQHMRGRIYSVGKIIRKRHPELFEFFAEEAKREAERQAEQERIEFEKEWGYCGPWRTTQPATTDEVTP
jgi:hypothetical protein